MISNGTWWYVSKKDPRWNISGYGPVGGFVEPREAKNALVAKKAEIGEEPPDDLEFGYMKD